jgi:hypothetical protein
MGRINKYNSIVKPHIENGDISSWVQDMTEYQICEKLNISVSAFNEYKKQHSELQDALNSGRTELVSDLKKTLIQKAKGYQDTEVKENWETRKQSDGSYKLVLIGKTIKTFNIPPDLGAISLLMKNYAKSEFTNEEDWDNLSPAEAKRAKQALQIKQDTADKDNW